MQVFPSDYRQALDLTEVFERVKDKTTHERAKEAIDEILPSADPFRVAQQLAETKELAWLLSAGGFPNFSFIDLSKTLHLLNRDGAVLLEDQVMRIRRASIQVNELLDFFDEHTEYQALIGLLHEVYFTDEIKKEIDKILDIHGQVKSSASRELDRIRRKLQDKRQESDRRFQSAVSKLKNQGMLRDFEETVFKNRRVLAVPAEYKRMVNGMILSHSANQLTAYIEPKGNLKLNLDIDELVEEERREIFKILRKLTQFLRRFYPLIKAYDSCLLQFEVVRCKARFGNDYEGIAPNLSEEPMVELHEAKHPLLYLNYQITKRNVVPLSLDLRDHSRVIVISGPNAGGKSVSLKTVGLLQLMTQMGFLIPAEENSTVGIYKKIFVDVGDTQSIEYELSTYSSKLNRLNTFLRECDAHSLFLIDEFGTGSDPDLGGALAESILENLVQAKAYGIVTTHYANIKRFAEEHRAVLNANMVFDLERLKPKYELVIGMPGSSYTFEVAQNTGLPKAIVNKAKKLIAKDRVGFDKLLGTYSQKLEKVERELENLKAQSEALADEKEHAQNLQQELDERLSVDKKEASERSRYMQYGKFLEDLLSAYDQDKSKKKLLEKLLKRYQSEKIKELENKKSALQKAKKKRKPRHRKIDPKQYSVGDTVRLKNSRQKGEIVSIQKEKAEVNVGFVKTVVNLSDLRPINLQKKASKKQKKTGKPKNSGSKRNPNSKKQ